MSQDLRPLAAGAVTCSVDGSRDVAADYILIYNNAAASQCRPSQRPRPSAVDTVTRSVAGKSRLQATEYNIN